MELQLATGLTRLHPGSAALLSGQQAAVLAVLIAARGTPLRREAITAAMPPGYRPPTAAQIGVVISHIRRKIGAARILTGTGGWWLQDPARVALPGDRVVSHGDLRLDLEHKYVHDGSTPGIRLGPQEFAVLRVLVEARGAPRSARQIWSASRPPRRPATVDTVRVIIHRLRQRLGRHRIITGRGGWRLADPASVRPLAIPWPGVPVPRDPARRTGVDAGAGRRRRRAAA
ncbi:winged helix-turn-helix domain-containing protein [Micromonospora sp. NPDC093277]|uniref:winged helix-turn-helix domain-containing protein n=1 Tax=Micromonospora sp. NPDC093277 TaxID=3364291 RepID=UPI0037F5B7F4